GSGLGLSTAYGIVKQTGGYIWVDSIPGEGTRMQVCLPMSEGLPAAKAGGEAAAEETASGGETVLVVEDELSVRTIISKVLEQHGFRVLTASHPAEALARWGDSTTSVDLLLTDIVLPDMDGYELADRFARGHPRARTLYSSGYSPEAYGNRRHLRPGGAFLQKPFDSASLVAKVREALDNPSLAADGGDADGSGGGPT
ncbi:MAG: response regulator, partial [Holophagales bacterium]|nr:response regulator [Holophagales bacterium]